MEAVRQYFTAVIALAILCGIVTLFFHDSGHKSVVKIVTGLMIMTTALRPILSGEEIRFDQFWENVSVNSQMAVQEGKDAAASANAEYIMGSMESYICSKAKELGADVTVKVELQEDGLQIPKKVQITGRVSPYVKGKISDMIVSDLGVEEDRQIWIS